MVLSIVHGSYNIFNSYLKKAAEVSLEESKKLHEFRIGRFANLQSTEESKTCKYECEDTNVSYGNTTFAKS